MIAQDMDSHIHFRHEEGEIKELAKAVIPMMEYIAVVARSDEKYKLKLLTGCKYFRVREARSVRDMLLRACKYARGHLCDYFPSMQEGIVANVENLEDATERYWHNFERLKEESIPVH